MPVSLSLTPTRRTPADILGVLKPTATATAETPPTNSLPLAEDDPVFQRTKDLIEDGFAGVILSGPPGTSKSWYARRLALSLADSDPERVRFVQFHPSYQYEDFIESYEPTDSGGFKPKARTFLTLCEQATVSPSLMFVLVIDELSRCDAVRVFGEALTYLEKSQRNVEFELASGRRVQIPSNIFIVATMNPWDRGVDELDMAFERRFAKISMDPDVGILETMLKGNGLPDVQVQRLVVFFRTVQQHRNQFARIGHAYFSRVGSVSALQRLWDYQLRFHFEKAFRQSPQEFTQISDAWKSIFQEAPGAAAAPAVPAPAAEQAIEIAQQPAAPADGAAIQQ
jgi:5-methylcytosine-specific restriction protein B